MTVLSLDATSSLEHGMTLIEASAGTGKTYSITSLVLRLMPGPRQTLVAGFGNGHLGIWSLATGKRLHHARLQGGVRHLLLKDRRLHAASELGHTLTWDLGIYYLNECALLRKVWRGAPLVWKGGRAVEAPAPPDHRCSE